jgi:hypothetical protein
MAAVESFIGALSVIADYLTPDVRANQFAGPVHACGPPGMLRPMKPFTGACLLPLFAALMPAGAAAEECDARFAKSPQFAAKDCTFQNPPNPNAKPHRSSWATLRTCSSCAASGG